MPENATPEQVAWAAGFFEGEGYFYHHTHDLPRAGKRVYPRMSIKNTDLAMLERFQAIVGVGKITPRMFPAGSPLHWKSQWVWNVSKRTDTEHVFDLLKPWLSARRMEQAAGLFDERGDLRAVAKTECPRGHPYSAENTYVWGKYRWCRTCQADAKRAREVTVA